MLIKTLSAATEAAGASAELQKTAQRDEAFQKFMASYNQSVNGTGQGIANADVSFGNPWSLSLQDGVGKAIGTSAESLQKTAQMNESLQKFMASHSVDGTGQRFIDAEVSFGKLQDSLPKGVAQESFRNLQAEVRNGNDAVHEHLDKIHGEIKNESQGVLALMKQMMDIMRDKMRSLRSTNKDLLSRNRDLESQLQKSNARVVEVEAKADTSRIKVSHARVVIISCAGHLCHLPFRRIQHDSPLNVLRIA